MMEPRRFEPRPPKPTLRPRRVGAGVKLRSREGPDMSSWAAQRWMRLVEDCAPGDQLSEGIQYAKLGQTRSMDIQPGVVTARVQGRMPDAYNTAVRLPKFQPEHWEQILASMTTQARYAATLLAGDLPANIEDIFIPLGLKLFPSDPSEIAVSCTCDIARGIVTPPSTPPPSMTGHPITGPANPNPGPVQQPAPEDEAAAPATGIDAATGLAGPDDAGAAVTSGPVAGSPAASAPVTSGGGGGSGGGGVPGGWCKHVCCVMALLADRYSADPFLIFTLRGMPGAELLERLTQRRSVAGAVQTGTGASPIYLPHMPGISDAAPPSLESVLDDFWTVGPTLSHLEMPIELPEIAHPLLRRLGPSPFEPTMGAKFPLVGLMATCYDMVSAAAVRSAEPPLPKLPLPTAGEAGPDGDAENDSGDPARAPANPD